MISLCNIIRVIDLLYQKVNTETSLCLVCCPGCRRTKICLSAYSKYKKSENEVTNMIRSDPNKLSDCGTFSVDLREKEDLKEGVKNSSGVFWLLADSTFI